MNILKAYAHQVVSYHPANQRDELFAEIYDELCEEYEDWQAQNPGLDEAEFLNRCKQHPMRYATQLAPENSAYLVGPRFYFSFISTLKNALAIVVVFHVVIGALGMVAGGFTWGSVWGVLASIPNTFLWVGACVLGVFVALEKSGENASWLEKWSASDLKQDSEHHSIPRLETAFDLGFSTFGFLWIIDVLEFPALIRHDGEWISGWSVNLPDIFWLVAGLMLLFGIGFSIYRMSRTLWTRKLRVITIVENILWIGLLSVAASQAGLLSAEYQPAAEFLPLIEKATKVGLLIACLIVAWDSLVHTWRLFK
jgi:hypothetical protein